MKHDPTIKAVIFDMGGVLLRTEDQKPRQQMAERLGLTYQQLSARVFDSDIAAQAMVGKVDEEDIWKDIQQAYKLTADELAQLRSEFWAGDRIDFELIDWIRGLRKHYRTGLLSNAWTGARRALSERFSFQDVFDITIFSAEVGMVKPDAAIYQHTLQELKVAPAEAVFVDDFPENIAAARKMGLHTVHFQSREQALAELRDLLGLDENE